MESRLNHHEPIASFTNVYDNYKEAEMVSKLTDNVNPMYAMNKHFYGGGGYPFEQSAYCPPDTDQLLMAGEHADTAHASINVQLLDMHIWRMFSRVNNEMIVTKNGR